MAYNVGEMYPVVNVPIRLYISSTNAAKKITEQAGWVQTAKDYKIATVYWATASGEWSATEPATGGVALYAIQDNPYGTWYTIGWVRDDENIKGISLYQKPTSISTNDTTYQIGFDGTKGVTYDYTAKIGNTVIHTDSNTLTTNKFLATYQLTATRKNLIYSALGNNLTGVMSVTVVSKFGGKEIRRITENINIAIPAGGEPTFSTNPAITVVNAVGGKAYQNISSVKVTNGTVSYKDGASFKSIRINIGQYSSSATSYTSPVINTIGDINISVTVTDSRNRSVTYTNKVTFLQARAISIVSFTATRQANNSVLIKANGTYMSAIDGTPKYSMRYKERGLSTWSTLSALTNTSVSGGNYSVSRTVAVSTMNASKSYDIELTVTGNTSTTKAFAIVGTESVAMSWGKHGISAGTVFNNSNSANLQVGSGGINSSGPISVGSGGISSSGAISVGGKTVYHQGNLSLKSINAIKLNGKDASTIISEAISGATPTYGTGSNGKYWRTGNLQICTGKVTLSSGGNGYYYAGAWTFPASFYSASEIYCSANVSTVPNSANYANWNGNATMHSPTTTRVSMWWAGTHDTKTLAGTVTLDVIAIGRWKA